MTTLTQLTNSNRRDEFGFLMRRVVKLRPAPVSARTLMIGMLTCWLMAAILALSLVVRSLP